MKNLKVKRVFVPIALAGTLAITGLTGCGKKMECNIEYDHLHKYVNEDGFVAYKKSEREFSLDDNMTWTPEVVDATEELERLSNYDLLRIEDNLEVLEKIQEQDAAEVQYQTKTLFYTPTKVGNSIASIPHYAYPYSDDSDVKNSTGYARDVEYSYRGFKISEGFLGSVNYIKSDLVDNIDEIKEEYPYFKLNDYRYKSYSKKYKVGESEGK